MFRLSLETFEGQKQQEFSNLLKKVDNVELDQPELDASPSVGMSCVLKTKQEFELELKETQQLLTADQIKSFIAKSQRVSK